MEIEIRAAGPGCLAEYAGVSIAFTVHSLLRPVVQDGGLGGIALHEEPVTPPYLKDYDLAPEGGPQGWAGQWDLTNWGFFLAYIGPCVAGAAAVAWQTPGVNMLEGRDDLAVLWDIRVSPTLRGQGIGRRLFAAAVAWARARGGRRLKVETQNINVPACRFYRAQGCTLGAIHLYGYAGQPHVAHEVMLLWYLSLTGLS